MLQNERKKRLFHFPFAANKQKLLFSINSIYLYIYIEIAAYILIYLCIFYRLIYISIVKQQNDLLSETI